MSQLRDWIDQQNTTDVPILVKRVNKKPVDSFGTNVQTLPKPQERLFAEGVVYDVLDKYAIDHSISYSEMIVTFNTMLSTNPTAELASDMTRLQQADIILTGMGVTQFERDPNTLTYDISSNYPVYGNSPAEDMGYTTVVARDIINAMKE